VFGNITKENANIPEILEKPLLIIQKFCVGPEILGPEILDQSF
jgi:hypothetical protein